MWWDFDNWFLSSHLAPNSKYNAFIVQMIILLLFIWLSCSIKQGRQSFYSHGNIFCLNYLSAAKRQKSIWLRWMRSRSKTQKQSNFFFLIIVNTKIKHIQLQEWRVIKSVVRWVALNITLQVLNCWGHFLKFMKEQSWRKSLHNQHIKAGFVKDNLNIWKNKTNPFNTDLRFYYKVGVTKTKVWEFRLHRCFRSFLPHFTTLNKLLHLFDCIYGRFFERQSK